MDELSLKLLNASKENKVVTLREQTFNLLLGLLKKNKIKNILEIGTGIGYSSYRLHLYDSNIVIDTIEKDQIRYNKAIELLGHFKNINFFNVDCFNFNNEKKYDLIIIDGPKNNQIKLFNYLLKFANEETIFFIDNLKLDKIRNLSNKNHYQEKIIKSLDSFYKFLINHNDFNFEYFDIDDGVMIGSKKWN